MVNSRVPWPATPDGWSPGLFMVEAIQSKLENVWVYLCQDQIKADDSKVTPFGSYSSLFFRQAPTIIWLQTIIPQNYLAPGSSFSQTSHRRPGQVYTISKLEGLRFPQSLSLEQELLDPPRPLWTGVLRPRMQVRNLMRSLKPNSSFHTRKYLQLICLKTKGKTKTSTELKLETIQHTK